MSVLDRKIAEGPTAGDEDQSLDSATDVYFSADVETDGPIPGPYSILSFAIVYAGSFDGTRSSVPETTSAAYIRS